jgi:hypothetical protein
MMKEISNRTLLKWPVILLLAALAGFVILSWKVYDHFNFILLEKAQLPEWKSSLVHWQVILSIIIPPVAGWLADYFALKNKNYLFITICMGITAMIFITTALITGDTLATDLQPALPYMMICWMTGMYLFFSPAMILIEHSAERTHLPIAISIVIFVGDLIYATNKIIIKAVESLGSAWIFAGAGIVLAVLGYFYAQFNKNLQVHHSLEMNSDSAIIFLIRAFIIGLIGGIAKGLFNIDSIQNLSNYLHFTDILSLIIFISAFVVIILSLLLRNQASKKILSLGILINISGVLLTLIASGSLLAMLSLCLIILGISMISLSIYSVALFRVPQMKLNLAFGLFYSGFSLSGFILNSILHG